MHSLQPRSPCVVAVAIALAIMLASCTTLVEPTTCSQAPMHVRGKQQGTTACGDIHDARFCDYVATAVEGADCGSLRIVPSEHFCVVTRTSCVDTSYAVKGHDCKVARYEKVRNGAFAEECPAGAPFFINR
jgi:hypothetical protein